MKEYYQKNKKTVIIWGSAVILIIIAIATSPKKKTSNTPEGIFISAMLDHHRSIDDAVESAVKQKLKYPEESNFDRNEGYSVVDLSSNKGGTRGYVTAVNAFGVKQKVKYEAVFILNGDQVNVDRVNVQEGQ